MNGLQAWLFVFAVAALAARASGRVRIEGSDLPYVAAAATVALAQRLAQDQVTLDNVFFAPLLVAIPLVAAALHGARAGVSVALASWMILTAVAGSVTTPIAGELAQESFALAALCASLLAGIAGALPPARRPLAPLLALGWLAFFGARDAALTLAPSIVAVPVLGAAWASLLAGLLGPATPAEADG